MTLYEELDKLLYTHNWRYMYSDDNKVFIKGQEERERINKLLTKLGKTGYDLFEGRMWGLLLPPVW